MKTKEAIEFLENGIDMSAKKTGVQLEKEYLTKMDDVYTLLKRGEKYEKIFNTILNWIIHDGSFIPAQELINLEQKYFPK